MAMLEIFLFLSLGYAAGLLTHGIRIYHEGKPEPRKEGKEYNPSTEHLLPPEIRDYYEKNDGFIR